MPTGFRNVSSHFKTQAVAQPPPPPLPPLPPAEATHAIPLLQPEPPENASTSGGPARSVQSDFISYILPNLGTALLQVMIITFLFIIPNTSYDLYPLTPSDIFSSFLKFIQVCHFIYPLPWSELFFKLLPLTHSDIFCIFLVSYLRLKVTKYAPLKKYLLFVIIIISNQGLLSKPLNSNLITHLSNFKPIMNLFTTKPTFIEEFLYANAFKELDRSSSKETYKPTKEIWIFWRNYLYHASRERFYGLLNHQNIEATQSGLCSYIPEFWC